MVDKTNRQLTPGVLELIMPQGSDPVDIEDLNTNFEIIDAYCTDHFENQLQDVTWEDVKQKPIDPIYTPDPGDYLAFKGDIPSDQHIQDVITAYIGSDLPDTIEGIQSTLDSHEQRITDEENKKVEDLKDVTITGIADGDTLVWNASQQKWVNGEGQTGTGLIIDNGLLCCQYEG